MRIGLVALAAGMLLPALLAAQEAPCTPGLRGYVGHSIYTQPGSPFSATLVETFTRKLGDGTTFHGVMRTFQARDSSGRARMETEVGCSLDDQHHAVEQIIVRIADPNQHTFLDWYLGMRGAKVATLRPNPVQPKIAPLKNDVSVTLPGNQGVLHRESLGTKFIDGVAVEGTRTTVTIAAGEQGNDKPIITMHEMWTSKELGLIMASTDDDPARGHSEMVLENFTRAEPDRALFAPPAGYTIKTEPAKASQ